MAEQNIIVDEDSKRRLSGTWSNPSSRKSSGSDGQSEASVNQQKNSGPHPVDGCTPSTSTGRSSQSSGSTSSIGSGHVKKSELRDALAELAHSGDLDFDAIGRVEQYVTKCNTGLHTFMGGTKEYRASVVRKYLGNDSQKTEIPDSMRARN